MRLAATCIPHIIEGDDDEVKVAMWPILMDRLQPSLRGPSPRGCLQSSLAAIMAWISPRRPQQLEEVITAIKAERVVLK